MLKNAVEQETKVLVQASGSVLLTAADRKHGVTRFRHARAVVWTEVAPPRSRTAVAMAAVFARLRAS